MTLRRNVLALAVVSVFVAGGAWVSAALQARGPHETGPVYALEGAWYGMTNILGTPPTPTLDTFSSDAVRHGVAGSFLCTIPAAIARNQTPSGHGNWVRIGTNTYAFTAMRAVWNGSAFVGWGKYWGTITAVSDAELTGSINVQFYLPDGTATSPQLTGTLERHRVEITFEQ